MTGRRTLSLSYAILIMGLLLSAGCAKSGYSVGSNGVTFGLNRGHHGVSTTKLPGADPKTFEVLSGDPWYFAKDEKQVYFQDQVLEECDPKTFQVLTITSSRDATHYYRDSRLVSHDPDNFQPIAGPWARDSQHLYNDFRKVESVNPDDLKILSDRYAFDGQTMYHFGRPLEVDAGLKDVRVFATIDGKGSVYWCNGQDVYAEATKLEGAVVDDLEVLEESRLRSGDKEWQGKTPINNDKADENHSSPR